MRNGVSAGSMKKSFKGKRPRKVPAGGRTVGRAASRTGSRRPLAARPGAGRRQRRSARTHRQSASGRISRAFAAKAAGSAAARWQREGAADGAAWRAAHPAGTAEELWPYAQRAWTEKAHGSLASASRAERKRLCRDGSAYAAGIRQGSGMEVPGELLPLKGTASAVVYAGADAQRLRAVLAELERLPLVEIVVVLGPDALPMQAELLSHPRIVTVGSPDGYASPHAARAAGARLTGADTVLFADGAEPCPARLLGLLLVEADAGADAVLSDRTAQEGTFDRRGGASWLREFLNVTLGKPGLRANAVGGVPFALSRRALDAIGPEALEMPARAQASLLASGLRVAVCDDVPFSGERDSPSSAADYHTAAWLDCLSARGARLGFPDHKRNRQAIGGGGDGSDDGRHPQL